jgi:hypothetical protein
MQACIGYMQACCKYLTWDSMALSWPAHVTDADKRLLRLWLGTHMLEECLCLSWHFVCSPPGLCGLCCSPNKGLVHTHKDVWAAAMPPGEWSAMRCLVQSGFGTVSMYAHTQEPSKQHASLQC